MTFIAKPKITDVGEPIDALLSKTYGAMLRAYRQDGTHFRDFNPIWDEFVITLKNKSDIEVRSIINQNFDVTVKSRRENNAGGTT